MWSLSGIIQEKRYHILYQIIIQIVNANLTVFWKTSCLLQWCNLWSTNLFKKTASKQCNAVVATGSAMSFMGKLY